MKWKDITLATFQQLEAINNQGLTDIDRVLYSICVVYKKTEHQINNEDPKKVVRMMGELNLFATPFNPRAQSRMGKYIINYDVSSITFGQYIELAYYLSKGQIECGHLILATMSKQWLRNHSTRDHNSKAEYFLQQPIEYVVGSLKAIQDGFESFNSRYKSLFGLDVNVSGDVEGNDFNRRYGWIYSATCVAEHERITLDEAFVLPVIQAFNDLAFLKAKGKYEMEQFKKQHKSLI